MTRNTGIPDPDLHALQGELRDLGSRWRQQQASPDLLPRVLDRINVDPAPRLSVWMGRPRPRLDWRRPWVRTLSVALALTAGSTGVLAGSASARETIAELLRLPGVTVTHAPAGATPAPRSTDVQLRLGQRVSFAAAQKVAPFKIAQPTLPGFGDPDAVYVLPTGGGTVISLTYRPRPDLPVAPETGSGLLLNQFQGSIDKILFEKVLYGSSAAERIQVNGHQGIWIEGPHELITFISRGNGQVFPPREAANSLLWESDGVILRIETSLPLEQALLIAQSVR